MYIENRGLGESIFAQQHVRAHSGYPGKPRDWVKHQKLASNRENKPRRESTGEEKITESRLKLSKVKFEDVPSVLLSEVGNWRDSKR